jgi:hypothetical protein
VKQLIIIMAVAGTSVKGRASAGCKAQLFTVEQFLSGYPEASGWPFFIQ